jgi:type IV secretory pathway TrbD component
MTQVRPDSEKTDLEAFLMLRLPSLLKRYANHILLGITLLAVGIWAFNQRARAKREAIEIGRENIATGWSVVSQLGAVMNRAEISPEAAFDRVQLASQAVSVFDSVLSAEVDPSQKAWALLGRGEAFWLLANSPAVAVATTQPVVGFATQTSDGYLSQAESAYRQILTEHENKPRPVITSLFSLAAIAENRGDLETARDWYARVLEHPSLNEFDRRLADIRLEALDELRTPLLLSVGSPDPTTMKTTTSPTAQEGSR